MYFIVERQGDMSDIKVKHKLDWGSDISVLVNDWCNHADTSIEINGGFSDHSDDSMPIDIEVCNGRYCNAWRSPDRDEWEDEGWVDPEDAPKPRKTNGKLVLQ